jgi:hypothetical protein
MGGHHAIGRTLYLAGAVHVRRWGHHAIGRTQYLAGALNHARARADLELACKLAESVPDYHALALAPGNLGLVMIEQGVREALVRSPRRPLVQQARR